MSNKVFLEYPAALQNTAHYELLQSELEMQLLQFLKAALSPQDFIQYQHKAGAVERNKEAIKSARKWQSDKKAELVEYAATSGSSGRDLHKHILITETTEVVFEDVGQAAVWLCSVGRSEDITIKVFKLDWYRDHAANKTLPSYIKLCNVPLIRIDSVWD